jgi:hypothetical protein
MEKEKFFNLCFPYYPRLLIQEIYYSLIKENSNKRIVKKNG